MVRSAIVLAEVRGQPAPSAAELVGAMLNEPGCEAWKDLATVGVSEASIEMAQSAAFAHRRTPAVRHLPPPTPREGD